MKYKYDFEKMEAMLTGFGLKGWELTNVVQDTGTDGRKYLILFLKKEIQSISKWKKLNKMSHNAKYFFV